MFAASGCNFDIYNEILKNDLPIKYIEDPRDPSLECGWFVFEDTLIIPNVFSFEFASQSRQWNYCCEVEEENAVIMPLAEYIETELLELNELLGRRSAISPSS